MAGTEAARIGLESILEYLTRVERHLLFYGDDRKIPDESDKHAIRILRSRKRLLERIWISIHGVGEAKEIATKCLHFPMPDDGTLVEYGLRKHGQGRLDCQACDSVGDGVPGSSICEHCGMGVAHLLSVELPMWVGLCTSDGVKEALRADMQRLEGIESHVPGVKYMVQGRKCDNCGHTEEVSRYQLTERVASGDREFLL